MSRKLYFFLSKYKLSVKMYLHGYYKIRRKEWLLKKLKRIPFYGYSTRSATYLKNSFAIYLL